MKVKCINNNGWEYLTVDKTYEVIEDDNWYWIINDSGDEHGYPKELFKSFSEIKNETIRMKVKCIKEKEYTSVLTVGKTYNVIDKNDYFYCITDDKGGENWFGKFIFTEIK